MSDKGGLIARGGAFQTCDALRTVEDLRQTGERGKAMLESLAGAGAGFAFALAAEGKQSKDRARDAGRLSHTLDFLNAEDILDLDGRIEDVLSRFTKGLDPSMRGHDEI